LKDCPPTYQRVSCRHVISKKGYGLTLRVTSLCDSVWGLGSGRTTFAHIAVHSLASNKCIRLTSFYYHGHHCTVRDTQICGAARFWLHAHCRLYDKVCISPNRQRVAHERYPSPPIPRPACFLHPASKRHNMSDSYHSIRHLTACAVGLRRGFAACRVSEFMAVGLRCPLLLDRGWTLSVLLVAKKFPHGVQTGIGEVAGLFCLVLAAKHMP
jgi:hypothetical protein